MIKLNKEDRIMKNYVLFKNQRNHIIKAFILLLTVEDFYYDIDDVLFELSTSYGKDFTIVVDHFITNGFSFNRFARIDYFEGIVKKSLVSNLEISDFYDNAFIDYLKKNRSILDESSLSIRAKKIIETTLIV